MTESPELSVARRAAAAGARIAASYFDNLSSAGIETKPSDTGYQGLVTRADTEANDEFVCQRGRGATHNGKLVAVNLHAALPQTMLAVGFYYDRDRMMRATLDAIEECFRQQIQGVRRMGSAALEIVQVGLGRFGGFFEYQLAPWDFAAARLFLEEAGGEITTCLGHELPLVKTSVLATNGRLHQPLLAIVRRHATY